VTLVNNVFIILQPSAIICILASSVRYRSCVPNQSRFPCICIHSRSHSKVATGWHLEHIRCLDCRDVIWKSAISVHHSHHCQCHRQPWICGELHDELHLTINRTAMLSLILSPRVDKRCARMWMFERITLSSTIRFVHLLHSAHWYSLVLDRRIVSMQQCLPFHMVLTHGVTSNIQTVVCLSSSTPR